MKESPFSTSPVGYFLGLFLFLTSISKGQETEAPIPPHAPGHSGEGARIEAWESLSPEQREKLREALRKVWSDPGVVSARAEVKQASDAYQAAVKNAVSKADPTIADALAKLQKASSGMLHEHISGRPPGVGMGPKRGFEEELKPPGFLESLNPESREKFRIAEAEAMKSESVLAVKGELEKIRRDDEEIRSKRLDAYRRLRKSILEEMVRFDPSVSEMQSRLVSGERVGPPPANRMREVEGEAKRPEAVRSEGLKRPE